MLLLVEHFRVNIWPPLQVGEMLLLGHFSVGKYLSCRGKYWVSTNWKNVTPEEWENIRLLWVECGLHLAVKVAVCGHESPEQDVVELDVAVVLLVLHRPLHEVDEFILARDVHL